MRYYFIVILLIVLYSESKADDNKTFHFSPGVSYQGIFTGEICALYGVVHINHNLPATSSGIRFGSEVSMVDGHILVGPKIGYEACLLILGFRCSAVSYFTPGRAPDFRLLPEVGISILTRANIFYGYSIPGTKEIQEIGRHRVTVSINLWRQYD